MYVIPHISNRILDFFENYPYICGLRLYLWIIFPILLKFTLKYVEPIIFLN